MTTALAPVEYDECFRLLAQTPIGRVVATAGALPLVEPVCFGLDGHGIVFRTEPGSCLAAATAGSVVAFEVDEIDPLTSSGWSVVVTGVAHHVGEASALLRVAQTNVGPWLPNDHLWVRITPGIVTGRRLERPPHHARRGAHEATPAA